MVEPKLFEWGVQYAVDVPEIDSDHQVLFAIVNELHQAMLGGKSNDALTVLLSELVRYTGYHFEHEERLMAKSRYPGLLDHRRDHDLLRAHVASFQQRFTEGDSTMSIQLLQFLMGWIQRHTSTIDRRLGEFLRRNG